jgi:hypothetical protein
MRLLILCLLLSTTLAAQTRIDTVVGPQEGMTSYRYITEMPAEEPMSKAEMFTRGIKPGDKVVSGWDRMDSLVVIDAEGNRLSSFRLQTEREKNGPNAAQKTVYLLADVVYFEGRIGKQFEHEVTVKNPTEEATDLEVIDLAPELETEIHALTVPRTESRQLMVKVTLPEGSVTRQLKITDGESVEMEVRFVLNGHDLNEGDFFVEKKDALAKLWLLPAGREVLFLRLSSTEKLMTVYKNGKVYSRIAVGRQLDEVNLIGLSAGDYMLEIRDLATGAKRYHGLRRTVAKK